MGADRPKQYLPLGTRSVLEWSVAALLADPRVTRVLVVVSPGDHWAQRLALPARCALAAVGAASRAGSVRNGVELLAQGAAGGEVVLVHDAARPCLAARDLAALIDAAAADPQGGLLAVPVADTIKEAGAGTGPARSERTVDRGRLWRAQTPQLFPLQLLRRALALPEPELAAVTDEASAVERLGLRPRLVEGSGSNLKVTTPADLPLARAILGV